MAALANIIIRPLMTEKVSAATERCQIYGFKVMFGASKHQIKLAVEAFYGVKVVGVNTLINPGKLRRRGKRVAKSTKWKKALVQLFPGEKIELFKGV